MKEFDEEICFQRGSLFHKIWQIEQVFWGQCKLECGANEKDLGANWVKCPNFVKSGTTPVQF